jgi:hypothetical protein
MVRALLEATMTNTTALRASPRSLTSCMIALVVMAVGLSAATGCTTVAPYERGKLAHPTMGAADTTTAGEAHLRAINEGAVGGSGGTGSGCGCN